MKRSKLKARLKRAGFFRWADEYGERGSIRAHWFNGKCLVSYLAKAPAKQAHHKFKRKRCVSVDRLASIDTDKQRYTLKGRLVCCSWDQLKEAIS